MLLSMHIIADELKEFELSNHIEEGECTISGIRLFPSDECCTQENVYLGTTCDFLGRDSSSVIIAHRRDFLIVHDVSLSELFNQVLKIFEKYNHWDKLLKDSANTQDGYQRLLEIANCIIHFPMILIRNDMNILAITRNYNGSDVFDEFDECKYAPVLPANVIKRMKPIKRELYDTCFHDIVLYESGDGDKYNTSGRINILFRGNIWGYLYIFFNDPVEVNVYQLAKYIARYLEAGVHLTGTSFSSDEQYLCFISLLDGVSVNKSSIMDMYTLLHWDLSDTLKLYKIISLPNVAQSIVFKWIYNKLTQEIKNIPIFFYDNSIVIILNQTKHKSELLESGLEDILSLQNINCGASLSFTEIKHLASYYKQASFASEIFANYDYKIRHFSSHAFWCMIKLFRETSHWIDWIYPNIFTMMETDSKQGTDYFNTLSVYLKSQCNSKLTAKALHVHVNTVTYRLQKIQEILQVNFNDNYVLDYLRLCYGLLEYTDFENPIALF